MTTKDLQKAADDIVEEVGTAVMNGHLSHMELDLIVKRHLGLKSEFDVDDDEDDEE